MPVPGEHVLGPSIRKVVLFVLWVPSADRTGKPLGNQKDWVEKALNLLGRTFGGATAMPPCEGVWRDDDAGSKLIRENPVLVHCYAEVHEAQDAEKLREVGNFCRLMGKETRQGEVALLVDDVFYSIIGF